MSLEELENVKQIMISALAVLLESIDVKENRIEKEITEIE